MADQFYFDEGYIADGYFEAIRDAGSISLSASFGQSADGDIADTSGYFIPDYIADDYFALPIQEASASISVATTVSVDATKLKTTDAGLNASVTLDTLADRTRPGSANISTNATLSTTAGIVKTAEVTISGAFTPTITASVFKNHTAILDSQSTLNADAVKLTDVDVTLANIVNLNLQSVKLSGASATVLANTTLTVQLDGTLEANAGLAIQALATTNGGQLLETSSDLVVNATNYFKVRYADERPYNGTNFGLDFDNVEKFGTQAVRATENGDYAEFTARGLDFVPHDNSGPGNDSQMSIDVWVSQGRTDTTSNTVFTITSNLQDTLDASEIVMYLEFNEDSNQLGPPALRMYDSGTSTTYMVSDTNATLGYNHVRLLFDQTSQNKFDVAMYLNGSRTGYLTNVTMTQQGPLTQLFIGDRLFGSAVGEGGLFDEFRILKSPTLFADQGWSLSDTSITVPTTAFRNTDDTKILLHFDNDLTDDVSNTLWSGNATLPTTASVTADAVKVVNNTANLSVAATSSATAQTIIFSSVDLSAQATLAANYGVIKQANANISGAAQFNVSALAINPGDALLESQFSISADVERFKGIPSTTISAAAGCSAAGQIFIGIPSTTVSANASLTVDAIRIQNTYRILTHFDTTSAGIPNDDVYGNTYNEVVTLEPAPSNFVNNLDYKGITSPESNSYYTTHTLNSVYYPDGWEEDPLNNPPVFPYPESGGIYGVTIQPTNDIEIGTQDFAIEFRMRGGRHKRLQTEPILPFDYDRTYLLRQINDISISSSADGGDLHIIDPGLNIYFEGTADTLYAQGFADGGILSSTAITQTGWHHIALTRQQTGISTWVYRLFVDGVLEDNITVSSVTSYTFNNNTYAYSLGGYNRWTSAWSDGSGGYYTTTDKEKGYGGTFFKGKLDELRIVIGTHVYDNNFTIPITNHADTPTLGFIDLLTTTSINVNLTYIAGVTLDVNANTTLNCIPIYLRLAESSISSVTDLNIVPVKIVSTSAELTSNFTISIDAVKNVDSNTSLTAQTQLIASPARTRLASADLTNAFTLSAEPSRIRSDSASLNSAFTVPDTDYIRYRDADISTDAIASSLVAAAKIGDFFVNIEPRFTMSVTARKTTDTPITLNAVVTTQFDPIKSVFGEVDLAVVTTQTAQGDKIRAAEATLNSAFTSLQTVNKITGVTIPLNSVFAQQTIFTRVRFNTVDLNTEVTITPVGDRIRFGNVNLEVNTSVLATPFKVQSGSADLTAFAFNITAGRIIHLDPYYTLIVPQETGYIKVLEEYRTLVIEEETRVLIV